jgi:hypothetical protein
MTGWLATGFSDSSHEPGWRTFQIAKVQQPRVLPEHFSIRAGYNAADSRYSFVHCAIA